MGSGGCSTRMFDGGSSLVNMLIVAQGLAHVTSLIHYGDNLEVAQAAAVPAALWPGLSWP
jgi:hypothetical protein